MIKKKKFISIVNIELAPVEYIEGSEWNGQH